MFVFRLFLDLVAMSLLLVAMAYNWLGNAAHEIAGTAMFVLLMTHNIFNRRWYGTIAKRRREARGLITKTINFSLLASMLALLTTSVIISQTVFSFLPLTSSVTARQAHTMVAYLVLLIAAGHLGLHWSMIMGVTRKRFGITTDSHLRELALSAIAVVIACYGARSFVTTDVASKLLMRISTGFPDFQVSPAALVLDHVAIVGLFACVAHYCMKAVSRRRSAVAN